MEASLTREAKLNSALFNTNFSSIIFDGDLGSPLILSGPFRIKVYDLIWAILQQGLVYLKDNLGKFLRLIEDLGSLMHTQDTKGVVGKAARTTISDSLLRLNGKYLAGKAVKDGSFTAEEVKTILLGIWDSYFSDKDASDGKAQLETSLNQAIKENVKFLKDLNATTGLLMPTLIGVMDTRTLSTTGLLRVASDATIYAVLETLSNENVDGILGANNSAVNGGDMGEVFDSVSIGPKQGATKAMVFPPKISSKIHGKVDGEPGDGLEEFVSEVDAMIKTSLVLSAEQIRMLHKQGLYGKKGVGPTFNIRVTNPSNANSYVPKSHIGKLTEEISRLEVRPIGEEGLIHWRQVPLLSAEKKLRSTVFSGGTHRPYGIPIAFLNKSFFDTCRELDKSSATYSMCKATTLLYMLAPFNRNTMHALIDGNVRIPMGMDIFRPHMSVITEACAFLTPGVSELGFTALAGKDYITGQTVLTKEWNAHLSFWSGVIILHPENVYILHNLMINGMRQGFGTKWFTDPRTYNPTAVSPNQESIESAPSLFAIAIPFGEEPPKKKYISTSGKIPQLNHNTKSAAIKASKFLTDEVHYSTCGRYNRIWGFSQQKDSRLTGFLNFLGTAGNLGVYNTMCFQGTAMYWNPKKEEPNFVRIGQGHLGQNVGPGLNDVLKGESVTFPVFNYNTDSGYVKV